MIRRKPNYPRIILAVFCFILLSAAIYTAYLFDRTITVTPPPYDDGGHLSDHIDSRYAVLIKADDESRIVGLDENKRIYPASLTKIMTLLVVAENVKDTEDSVTVSTDIVYDAFKEGASVAGFSPGEEVKIIDLMYGAALPSGADATGMLALYIAGSEEKFVEMMNEKAAVIGMSSTHFANSDGLHDKDHYSTVCDIAKLLSYAVKDSLCREIMSAEVYTTSPTPEHPQGLTMYSTGFSKMESRNYGKITVIAAKTGYTPEAGNCFATYAEDSNGNGYVLVTACASDKYIVIADCEYIYTNYIG